LYKWTPKSFVANERYNEDGCLLICSTVYSGRSLLTSRFTIIRALITLVMEAVSTSKTLVDLYQTVQHYNPEDSHLHTHRREDLKSQCCLVRNSELSKMFPH
jgi:hypothetical protein